MTKKRKRNKQKQKQKQKQPKKAAKATLSSFIEANAKQIVREWEVFARSCRPAATAMDLEARRDHISAMLEEISRDLRTTQTKRAQASKSKGKDDAHGDDASAASSHGTDRAAHGYTPVQMVAEFRALRASVLRLWSKATSAFDLASIDEVTRFNEAIDQLLAESIARYGADVDHSKDLFLGVLGHDLRNPLGAIMMGASLMMSQEGADWPHMRTASRILKSGTRMDGMIRDLLDFTRSRLGGGIPVVRADIDLETISRQTVDEITAFHPSCVVNFRAHGDVRGQWDGGRIAQALSNLVGNAYQHGLKGAPLDVTVRGDRDVVLLTVHNKGRAIPKSQLRAIFDPFRQLDPAHAKSCELRSAGLGLYIAQAIVTAHGGTIEVESGKSGTTFTICLPREAPSEARSASKSPPSSGARSNGSSRHAVM